jgi:glycosyltransferase involved in cell wall biosynthesis
VCRPNAWIGNQLAGDGVDIVHSDMHRWPPDELRRISAICRSRNFDVIHTHMSRAHFFGVLLRWFSGVPCVATAHNRLIQPHWMFNDRVIANSEATRRFHRRFNLVGKKRIHTVHCFVDYDRFSAVSESSRQEIRAELGLSEEHLLVGHIGQVCPRKGVLYLVRAMPEVLATVPAARLVVVGCNRTRKYAKYVAHLRREAERLGVARYMVWTGARNDIPEILTALDVFVQASLEEAQGIAALEAMVRRVPVVATAVGGALELVIPDETGVLVPTADAAALARAILRLTGDPSLKERLVARGHDWVTRQFSPVSQVPRVEAVLDTAARERRAA